MCNLCVRGYGEGEAAGLIDPERFDTGIAALERTAAPSGTFCYSFFKATAMA